MMAETTVILANGEFPRADRPLGIFRRAGRIICCDGAASSCMQAGRLPDAVVGDLDSLSPEDRRKLADRVVHVPEQETNDLAKAWRHCLSHGWTRNVVILGATGKREDHTLGNIAHLADFCQKMPDIRMVTETGEFLAMNCSGAFETYPGQAVSIFAMDQQTPIRSEGLEYPLDGLAPDRWWQATLNRATGMSARLEFPEGKTVLVFLQYP